MYEVCSYCRSAIPSLVDEGEIDLESRRVLQVVLSCLYMPVAGIAVESWGMIGTTAGLLAIFVSARLFTCRWSTLP
jgi:hypothetical protein